MEIKIYGFDIALRTIALVIGIPGNILAILVMKRKNLILQNISLYFIALAISDLTYLICPNSVYTFSVIFNVLPEINANGNYCKINKFFNNTIPQISSYLLVIISVERTLAVIYPHKVSTFF